MSTRRATARGASFVEYIIVLGLVALTSIAAFLAFGDAIRGVVGWEGDCVRTLSCQGGTDDVTGKGGSPSPPSGTPNPALLVFRAHAAFTELDDPAHPPTAARAHELLREIEETNAALAEAEKDTWRRPDVTREEIWTIGALANEANGLANRAREREFQVAAAESTTVDDFVHGFVVDGAGGAISGLWNVVWHPVDTATGVWTAATHPIVTYEAVRDGLAQRWEENPQRLAGAAVFEVVSLLIAPAKVAKAGTIAEEAKEIGAVSRVINAGDNLCPAGACAVPRRALGVNDKVLVPRSDGTTSGGKIVAVVEGTTKVVVEVPAADGQIGTKLMEVADLRPRYSVGDEVQVTHPNGEITTGVVTEVHEDGRITIGAREADGTVTARTGPEIHARPAVVDITRLREQWDLLPKVDRDLFMNTGITIDVQRGSVAGALDPAIASTTPRGYPPGSTFHDVHGVYLPAERKVVLSVNGAGDLLQGASVNVLYHEVGHGIDHALGGASLTPEFRTAVSTDFWSGQPAGILEGPYYKTVAEGGVQETAEAAMSEAYAESYALYNASEVTGGTYMQNRYPALYAYFKAQAERTPPAPP